MTEGNDSFDRQLRETMGRFLTGVTVVSVGDAEPVGMTTNSFTSVSLDPPLVLFCAKTGSRVAKALNAHDFFAVSILADHQEDAARHFASQDRGHGTESFAGFSWHRGQSTRCPILSSSIASLECRVWQLYDGGDHKIVVGVVTDLHLPNQQDSAALTFHLGRFDRPVSGFGSSSDSSRVRRQAS